MLTCEKLIKFDLLEEAEKNLLNTEPVRFLEFLNIFQEIKSIDQFIKDSPSFPGSTDKIIRSEMISIIGATLAIEGTVMDRDEIERTFEKVDAGAALQRKEQEVENSRKVYRFIIEFIQNNKDKIIYSEQLIRQLHSYFTENLNYLSNKPGEYRSDFNVTFGQDRKESLCQTRTDIDEAMHNFVEWLNKPCAGILSSNVFTKAIMAHYYLVEIHPFGDGNGRTARALEAMILLAHGINNYCFWSLANFWSTNKEQYIAHLHNIRVTLNPLEFLLWGLHGYKQEIITIKGRVLTKVKQLMLLDYVKYLYLTKKDYKPANRINPRIVDLIQLLIKKGRVPIKKFYSEEGALLYKKSSQSTKVRDFQRMADLGLIRLSKENEIDYIEPNYQLLETITYSV